MTREEKVALVRYRINRAKETLLEVEFQVENRKWHTAINRMYYACYYAVIALLAQNEIGAKTHSGVRQMFALHFIKPGIVRVEYGDFYTDIFEMRHTSDYDDFIVFDEEKVLEMLPVAKGLIGVIEQLLTDI